MDPLEVWWIVEAKKPVRMHGSLTEDEVHELWLEAKADGMLE